MPGTVVFLVRTGLLVLADQVALVVLHMHAADHADLLPAVHVLPVEVERRLLVPKQSALEDELIQRLPRPQVDPRVVGVHLLREIDVRPADVEEAARVAPGQLGRLRAVHHVVGNRRDLVGDFGPGAQRPEGVETHGGIILGG